MSVRRLLLLFLLALLIILGQAGLAVAQDAGAVAPADAPAVSAPAEAPPAVGAEAPPAAEDIEAGAGSQELTTGRAFLLKLKQGGTTMIFLLLASVAGVGYAVERLVNLRSGAIVPAGLAQEGDRLWRAGKWDELIALPQKNPSTLARVLAVIARHRHSSMADVSVMAGDVASRDLRRHLQKAYPLAVVATVSPLLGLLGTVVGMIGAFDKVAAAGSLGDASLLGGDISKALITTGAGLTIAVPALVLYHYFKSRTGFFAVALEEEVSELINDWYGADADATPPGSEGGNED